MALGTAARPSLFDACDDRTTFIRNAQIRVLVQAVLRLNRNHMFERTDHAEWPAFFGLKIEDFRDGHRLALALGWQLCTSSGSEITWL